MSKFYMDRRQFMAILRNFFLLCLVLYVGMHAYLYIEQERLLFVPTTTPADISKAPSSVEVITVPTEDGLELSAWWQPPPSEEADIIIFFHGNAGNLEDRLDKLPYLIDKGYGVLLAEYRGYGGNEGIPSEENLYIDARAHLDWLMDTKDIGPERFVIYGESLGSGVATQMATEYDAKALVLDVPFNNVPEVGKYYYPYIIGMDLMVRNKFANDQKIADIDMPVFIGTAGLDTVVPNSLGKKLFDLAREPKKHVNYPEATHIVLPEHGFYDDMQAFLQQL